MQTMSRPRPTMRYFGMALATAMAMANNSEQWIRCNATARQTQKWTEKTEETCHIQGGDRGTVRASICDNLWRTSVADQKHSQCHGTDAETVQSLHLKIPTSDGTQTYATDAQCRYQSSQERMRQLMKANAALRPQRRQNKVCGGSCRTATKEAPR